MPGSIALDDSNVRNKSIHYLPQGWEPVLEKEVDGPRSEPASIDGLDTRFGSVQAARRSMRTIFLGSAPSTAGQGVKGLQVERILLGSVQPDQTIGVFEDVLKRLRDKLHHLYAENDRIWLDTKPNLRREMESRKQNINDIEELEPLLKERVGRVFGRNHLFGGIHVFTKSNDVPDDYASGPRLVVLPPSTAYSRNASRAAYDAAEEILRNRGEQPRQKQNRLIFFAADYDSVSRLKDAGRTYLAWRSIANDAADEKLDLTIALANQAKRNAENAEKSLSQMVRETYKWIICPSEEIEGGKPALSWETAAISPSAQNLIQEIENRLKEEEWLITEWSPVHLQNVLTQWYFKDDIHEVNALKFWQDSCHYLYLPRLVNDLAFRSTLNAGISSKDYFAYASGKDGDRYLGFTFGWSSMTVLDESSLIIKHAAAIDYEERSKPNPSETPEGQPESSPTPGSGVRGGQHTVDEDNDGAQPITQISTSLKKQFYGNIELDPVKAKIDFATIVDEVIQRFTEKLGVEVTISVEVQAKSREGFDESLQRTIKENCSVLKFSSSEFDE